MLCAYSSDRGKRRGGKGGKDPTLTLRYDPVDLLGVKVANEAAPVSPRGSPPRLLLFRRGRGGFMRLFPFGNGITGGKGSSFWSDIVVVVD